MISTTGEEQTIHLTPQRCLATEEGHAFFLTEGLNLSQPWGKLYRRELFDGVRYPIGKLYEDIAVIARLVEAAKQIRILDVPVIVYRQSVDSISHTTNIRRQMDGLDARASSASRQNATGWQPQHKRPQQPSRPPANTTLTT